MEADVGVGGESPVYVPEPYKEHLQGLLSDFSDLFSITPVRTNLMEHKIDIGDATKSAETISSALCPQWCGER